MGKKAPIQINIPNPCHEDWDLMQKCGDGKFCTQCNNIVYDFSGMNDTQLLDFLKSNPSTHCGRFHNSQLQREILPQKNKQRSVLNGFNKIAAAFLTMLSFRQIGLHAENLNTKPAFALDADFKKQSSMGAEKIIITGRVRDAEDKLLAGAMVFFDSLQVTTTDENGKFSFELTSVTATNHTLYFSYDGLITVVRSYHPVMQSTDYDVVLYKQGSGNNNFTGGIIAAPSLENADLPKLVFAQGSTILSKKNKRMLDVFSVKLKENPFAAVAISTPDSHSEANRNLASIRAGEIKKYLVETCGISAERLSVRTLTSPGNVNTISIVNYYDY